MRPDEVDVRGRALYAAFDVMVRSSLRGVWVRGEVPDAPVLWATNHHHWWDAFCASSVLRRHGHTPTAVVAAPSSKQFGFLASIGVIAHAEPARAVRALREGWSVVIMPEGEMSPAGPLAPVHGGAVALAELAPAPLLPVATRVVLRGHQHAEAFVSIGPPLELGSAGAAGSRDAAGSAGSRAGVRRAATTRLAEAMNAELAALDELLRTCDPEQPLPGYRQVVPGRRSVSESIAAGQRRLSTLRSGALGGRAARAGGRS